MRIIDKGKGFTAAGFEIHPCSQVFDCLGIAWRKGINRFMVFILLFHNDNLLAVLNRAAFTQKIFELGVLAVFIHKTCSKGNEERGPNKMKNKINCGNEVILSGM